MPRPLYNRTTRPEWWLAAARANWELRCQMRLPPDLPPLEHVVQCPDDLAPFLALLREQKQYVNPLHLASRPPYMSSEPPQAEPCHTAYLSLFERIMLTSQELAALPAADVDALLAPFEDLIGFRSVMMLIKRRWDYERERVWQKRRAAFMRTCHCQVIGGALAPHRISHILETYGWEGLEAFQD